jgi:hypothetical protein
MLEVRPTGQHVILASRTPGAKLVGGVLRIPLPAVEVGMDHALPRPGATTQQLKVIDQQSSPNALTLKLAAQGGTHQTLMLRLNDPHARLIIDGAPQEGSKSLRTLPVEFGPGEGYVEKTLKLTW